MAQLNVRELIKQLLRLKQTAPTFVEGQGQGAYAPLFRVFGVQEIAGNVIILTDANQLQKHPGTVRSHGWQCGHQ